MMKLNDFYQHKADALAAEILLLKQRNKAFVAGEIVFFLLIITFIVLRTMTDWGSVCWLLAALSAVCYLVVRHLDVRNGEKIERKTALWHVYEHELAYLNGDFAPFADGHEYADAHHPFTFDLDIFGPQSLFHRINRTVTTGGSDRLAALLGMDYDGSPDEVARQQRRQEAIKELAAMEEWRARFMAIGQLASGKISSSAIGQAYRSVSDLHTGTFAGTSVALALAILALAGLWLVAVLPLFTPLKADVAVAWGVVQFVVVYLLCSGPLRKVSRSVDRLHRHLQAYVQLIRLLATMEFTAADNIQASHRLREATLSFEGLEAILNGLDRRGNILGMMLFNTFALSDFFLLRRFLKWQRLYMAQVMEWVDEVSNMDARVSMATFRYNEPAAVDAEVVHDEQVVYEAQGLYHPFLGAKAVRNDFTISDLHYYIITGANMAGKSTFLRSVGINFVLAMNGMPVFADAMTVSIYRLFSSMRTTDDLSHGISYFNAELLRLKQLLEACRANARTLIILDEILKGTNSLDKLNGSRLFLNSIANLPVSGVIATHDLELSKMAEQHEGRFHNYCFEIELAEQITYSYKIAPGVARNQNATYLLKRIIE